LVENVTLCDALHIVGRPTCRKRHLRGLEICYGPWVAEQDCRDRLIDATLNLGVRFGYEATSIDQIAASAGVTPAEFGRHFATKDAVIMSIISDLVQATAATLPHVDVAASPEQALLIATTEVMTAITDGRGVITRDRMLAMSEIVTAQPDLRKQASRVRKPVLTRALADRLGVSVENRRVRQAVTMWSAIASGSYVSRSTMADHYDPSLDDQLKERMVVELTASFTEVMGNDRPEPDASS
jgi:AcrR family transcriptional regulator